MNFGKILKAAKEGKAISLYYMGSDCFAVTGGAIYRLSDMPYIESPAEFFSICGIDTPEKWDIRIVEGIDVGCELFGIFTGELSVKQFPVERECAVQIGGVGAVLFGIPETEQLDMFSEGDEVSPERIMIPVSSRSLSPLGGIIKYKYLTRGDSISVIGAFEGDVLSALIRPDGDILCECGRFLKCSQLLANFAEYSGKFAGKEEALWQAALQG